MRPAPAFRPLLCLTAALLLAAPAAASPTLLISTENGPDHVQTRMVQRFAERVRTCCAERLEVVHASGGTLYRDRDVLPALAAGKVAMALPGTWQLDSWVPDIGAFMLPVFYGRDEHEVATVEDGPAVEALNGALEDALGAVVLGRWIGLGFAHLFTLDRPVADASEMKGLRIRLPGGAANAWRVATLGAEPVSVPWTEVPRAMADRRIDGLVSTYATLDSIKVWGRPVRFALEDRQMYTQYVPLISGRFWRQLDAALRGAVRAAWDDGVMEARAMTASYQRQARENALAAGVRIVTPTPERTREIRRTLLTGQAAIAARMGITPNAVERVSEGLPR